MNQKSDKPDILIVDDTPANLHLLLGMLQDGGYRVRPVTSGEQALKAVRSEPPDLILLDITMPGLNGYDVCRELKRHPATADIPVLFISALSETDDKLRAFEAGGVDYVGKPFQFAEVLARVRTHLTLRQRERELQESLVRERRLESLRDSLTHMVAHDMRSPLLAIGLGLDLLKRSIPAAGAEQFAMVQHASKQLLDLVNAMLAVSKMEAGSMELNLSTFDLTALAREVLDATRPLASSLAVKLEADGPVEISADRDLIGRVIGNLLGNAYKFAPAQGHVSVRVLRLADEPRLEVVDDGRGIAPEHHARIFEKFGQIETGKNLGGSGLGLTFCRMAVEAHGGKIGLVSAPGHGSTFWFTLPRRAQPARP